MSPTWLPRPLVVAVAVTAWAGAACVEAGDPVPADARVRVDTVDGVVHVVSGNRGAWVRGGSWRVVEDRSVVIGELEGPQEYTFGDIGGLVVGNGGRIYVGDRQSLDVRVFSPEGEFLHRFGRKGQGPGEFTDISGLARAPDGIGVLDGRQSRVTVFSPRGELLRTFRLQRPYMILERLAVMGFDDDGRFYDRARLSGRPLVDSMGVIVYGRGGEPVDTAQVATIEQDHLVVEREGVPIMSFPRPFSPEPSLAIGDGRIYFARGDEYRVVVFSPAGDTLRVLRRELQPRPVTDEERESALASVEERYREAAGSAPRGGVELPETKPMIADLHVDRAGNLWVATPPGPGWTHLEWAVHGPEGHYLGPVATPRMAVADIGEDYIAGVRADEMGVQRVVVYRMAR